MLAPGDNTELTGTLTLKIQVHIAGIPAKDLKAKHPNGEAVTVYDAHPIMQQKGFTSTIVMNDLTEDCTLLLTRTPFNSPWLKRDDHEFEPGQRYLRRFAESDIPSEFHVLEVVDGFLKVHQVESTLTCWMKTPVFEEFIYQQLPDTETKEGE